jgi:hypothetical protein
VVVDRTILTSPVAMEWLVLAGVAGAVFGPAGAWAAGRSPILAAAGLATGVALLLGDAWQLTYGSYGQTPSESRVLVLLALVMLALSLRRPWVTAACPGTSYQSWPLTSDSYDVLREVRDSAPA